MAPAPPRTVLALFTHTAPHEYTSRFSEKVYHYAGARQWEFLKKEIKLFPVHTPTFSSPVQSAMRCNFVATISLFLGIDDVSSQHCYSCDVLSSSGITRLHRYYDAIRLPLPRLPFYLYYRLSDILAFQQESRGPPGLPHIRNVRHAMVSDPGEVPLTCHSPVDILTSV